MGLICPKFRKHVYCARCLKQSSYFIILFLLGWIKTVDKYFHDQTVHILDNMVIKLQEHSKMKFIWAEMSYLSMWWESTSQQNRDITKRFGHPSELSVSHIQSELSVSHIQSELYVSHIQAELYVSHIQSELYVSHIQSELYVS